MTDSASRPGLARIPPALLVLGALVVTWRALAFTGIGAGGATPTHTDLAVRVLLTAMGLAFVGLGFFAYLVRGSRAALIFAFYGVFAGLHWGGPLPLPPGQAQLAGTLLYLVLSSLLAECLFLHFALHFPAPGPLLAWRGALPVLYLPVPLGAALAFGVVLAPETTAASASLTTAFKALYGVQTNLYALLSIAVITVRFVRADRRERRASGLGVLTGAVTVPAVVYVGTQAAGVHGDLVNLCMVGVPLGAAYALTRRPVD